MKLTGHRFARYAECPGNARTGDRTMTDYRCDTTRAAIWRAGAVRHHAGYAGQIEQFA
jgi:hypothetical protein